MINTKQFFLAALLFTGVTVLSFNESKDDFTDEYIEYYDALDNFRAVVKSHGDTASAQVLLDEEEADLAGYESRMIEESAMLWSSFESAWPGPPRNAACKLECAYQLHLCRTGGEGDLFMCLAAYNECFRNC